MRDLKKYGKECIGELESFGIDTGSLPEIEWKVSRAKSRFGQCRYRYSGPCEINISSFMLDERVLKDDCHLKNTIIHELLHALAPGHHHGGKWKFLADQVNIASKGKYHIERCGSFQEMGIKEVKNKPKYILKCKGCGYEEGYQRRSKVIQHPYLYRCAKCKSDFKVIEV